ncbi:hypothetical protein VTK26DRAFT_7451 [Humicola hyalothermophila]
MASSDGSEPKSYSTDPALYIYTSLTAGSSHIVTATSRLETILRANRVPFKAIDIATDEKARMLWGRRAGKAPDGRQRKLPGLVQMGMVLGDIVEIEEWNEYGELKDHVTFYYDEFTQPSIHQAPKQPATTTPKPAAAPPPPQPATGQKATDNKPKQPETVAAQSQAKPTNAAIPIRSIAEEAAQKAKQVHLQSLRQKVHGSSTTTTTTTKAAPETKDAQPTTSPAPATTTTTTTTTTSTDPSSTAPATIGLQSPTSGGWKSTGAATSTATTLLQNPTTTSWKPTDVDPPVRELHGSAVQPTSAEEVAAVEKAEMIKEEEESEEEESGSEKESESEEEEEGKKEEGKEKGEKK